MRRSVVLPGLAALTFLSLSRTAAAVNQGVVTADFEYVVGIVTVAEDGTTERCSAVLVTPTWLLTAAHCFVPHAPGAACGLAQQGPPPFNGDFTVDVWLSTEPPQDSHGNFVPPVDLFHTTAASGLVFSRLHLLDECSEFDSAHDLALVQLDTRIATLHVDPANHLVPIRPLHPSLNGISKCRDFVPDSFNFTADLVGYGPDNFAPGDHNHFRNYAKSAGWGLDYVNSSQTESVYQNNWNFGIGYNGANFGDSGGPLIAFSGNLDDPTRLCGIVSGGNIGGLPFIPEILNWDAAADSDPNLAFMAAHILDSKGRFMGECNEGPESLRDIDTDGDLIPDACDICRVYPARTHDGVNNYDLAHSNAPAWTATGSPTPATTARWTTTRRRTPPRCSTSCRRRQTPTAMAMAMRATPVRSRTSPAAPSTTTASRSSTPMATRPTSAF